ncbi:hypothetical protein PIN31009_01835 [Pandoraea iniqua]|uniref:Uncharacterized protein n=1 Tax=Pandoraea iniqua TaxID=2508288 RepID=A0A5E4UJX5_9BURK|nr:hypothetical protein PIN31009_01835 [Pandoraea iniqua]VVD99368.1 hypothetical protein PIN31115_02023 [Pandoraea iniqua]
MHIRWKKVYSSGWGSVHHIQPRSNRSAIEREQLFQRLLAVAIACSVGGFVLLSIGAAFLGR